MHVQMLRVARLAESWMCRFASGGCSGERLTCTWHQGEFIDDDIC